MEYAQFAKTKKYLFELDTLCYSPTDLRSLADAISIYYKDNGFLNSLKCYTSSDPNSCSDEDLYNDRLVMKTFLESEIDGVPHGNTISKIFDYTEKINRTYYEDYQAILDLIREVYYAFSEDIRFDDTVAKIATHPGNAVQIKPDFPLSLELLNGLKTKIETYADKLLSGILDPRKESVPQFVISNNNSNNNKQTVRVDTRVDVQIENAIKELEEASLSPGEEQELRKTIEELKLLLASEEAKNKKWNRFKEIVSGIANFSLKAAEILGPLVAAAWPK